MAIRYTCGACSYQGVVGDDHSGRQMACPQCLGKVDVPRTLDHVTSVISPAGLKNCPFCAQEIRPDARKCQHCGEFVDASLRRERVVEEQRVSSELKKFNREGLDALRKARTALICGVASMSCLGLVVGPIAIITGVSANERLKTVGIKEGRGMAVAAIILGIIGTAAWIVLLWRLERVRH
jgi:predicted nucleic acid-binding Zn ribbon protein